MIMPVCSRLLPSASWLTKTRTKAKRRKMTSSRPPKKVPKNVNYSLKPPSASTPFPGVTEFKFNTKTLSYVKEEHSPNEKRRQSMAIMEGIGPPKRLLLTCWVLHITQLMNSVFLPSLFL